MSDKTKAALKARKKKEEESFAEKHRKRQEKISAALKNRESRISSNLQSTLSDLKNSINAEIEAYNKVSNPSWGGGSEGLKTSLETTRQNRINVNDLIRKVEAHRKYVGDEETDSLLKTLNTIKTGHNSYVTVAKIRSEYETEEDYNEAVKKIENIKTMRAEDTDALKQELAPYEQLYNNVKKAYDMFEIPKVGDLNEKATREKGVVTYYTQKDVQDAIKKRDEYVSKGLKGNAITANMSAEELIDYVESKKDYITQVKYVQNYYYLTENDVSLDEIASHLNDEDPIAYTDLNGKNITWSSLYEKKKADEDFNALYNELSVNPDWEENSKYKPSYNAGGALDNDYETINGFPDAYKDSNYSSVEEKAYADVTTNEEKAIFNYLWHTQGKEAAMEWHKSRTNVYEEKRAEKTAEFHADFAKEFPIISDALAVYSSAFIAPLEYVANIAKGDAGEATESAAFSSTVKGTRMEQIDWEIGNWDAFDFLYSTTTSMAESALSMTAFGNAGGVTLGLSAAAQGTNDALDRGMSNKQAFWNGLAAGTFEGIFETVSIGKFNALKDSFASGGKTIAKNIAKSMLVNASEESLTEIANIAYDNIANADFSNYDTMVRAYTMQGMTIEQAEAQAKSDMKWQVVEAMASGALMGLGFGAIGSVSAHKKAKAFEQSYDTEAIDSLISEGLAIHGSEAYKLAQQYQAKLKEGKSLSAQEILDLQNATTKAFTESDTSKMKSAAEARLVELGETGDASQLAQIIAKQAAGQKLTLSEKSTLKNSKYGQRVANEMSPQNIASGEYSSGWAENIGTDVVNNDAYNGLYSIAREMLGGEATEETAPTTQTETPTAKVLPYSTEYIENVVNEFEVSADGKTINKNTDKIVNIKNFESISEDGEANLTLDDGMVVKASDLAYGSAVESAFIEGISGIKVGKNPISTTSANALYMTAMQAWKKNPDMTPSEAMSLIEGLKESYIYGAYNMGTEKLTATHPNGRAIHYAGELSQTQRDFAYSVGTQDKVSKAEADQKVIDELKAKAKPKATKKSLGKVIFEKGADVDESTLTKTQKANLDGIKLLAEISPIQFHVFKSEKVGKTFKYTMPDGTVTSANGWFVAGSNEIWVDLNAGNAGEGTMIRTAAHEISHYIKQWSPQKWRAMADLLMESLAKNGVDTEGMLNRQIDKIKRRYTKKTMPSPAKLLDMAHEEFVSDALSDMLTDGSIVNFIAEVKAKDRNLAQKILDAIKSLLKKWGLIIDDYKGRELDTPEAQALSQLEDTFKKLQEMYRDAFVDANEVVALTNDIVSIDADSKSVSPMMSERTWTESEYVTEREKTAKAISSALGVDIKTAEKYIDDINSVARLIAEDRVRLDYDPNLDDSATVLKKNSEYKYSVDMSTLCAKRLLTTGTFDAIQRKLPNTVFSSEDIVALREMMLKRGYEVACGICYVESTRREMGKITQDFINSYIESQKTGKPITRLNSSGKVVELKKTKDEMLTTADKSADKFYADKNYTPTLADLNTTDIDLVKKEHPLVYEAYLNFMNARGQAKPKLLETRAEYKGEILKHFKSSSAVNARNNAGGLRLQSFSDFEVPHLIDMMQIIMDMSRVGLKSQAYTKVPAFAEVFGNTGVKINLSLIAKGSGLDANGNLIFDDVEGINHEEAFRLRDKFSKNVGTILVGKTDAHIIAAMADPRIDYIIPFHKSSWKESLYEALGLTGYADYTDFQNEKPIDKDRKIKNFDPSEYWDFTKSGDENAQIYLAKCREDGRIPKFPQFQGYPGYWKLLIDFKMYDNDGVGSPQEVVNPTFEMDSAEKILNEYKGGHRSFPVAKDVVEDFVKDYVSNVKFSDRNFSYDELVAKDDLQGVVIDKTQHPKITNGIIDNDFVVKTVRNKCESLTHKGGVVYYVNVPDIGTNVEIINDGITHGFARPNDRRNGKSTPNAITNARVMLEIPQILNNSIEVNRSKRGDNIDVPYTHVLIGTVALEDNNGVLEYYAVRSMVQERKNQNPILVEANVLGKLTSVNAKKIDSPTVQDDENIVALADGKAYAYKIADLLNDVKNIFDNTFSEDVYHHFGMARNEDDFSKNLLFSDRDLVPTFYSQMGKVVEGVKQEKLGANSVVNLLRGKGVKSEEIRWSGIVPFLEGKKSVTKQELLDFINGSMLQIGEQMSNANFVEVVKKGNNYIIRNKEDGAILDTFYKIGRNSWENDSADYVESFQEIKDFALKEYGGTRWSQYKLDGGDNYREIVFTLPNSSYRNQMMGVHWGEDAEGVLVHARIQDFEVNGKKMLFIEEIQSDWHNEGHKDGYQEDAQLKKIQELESKANEAFLAVEDYSTELTGLAGEYEAVAKTQKGRELLRAKIRAEKELKQAQAQFDSKVPDAPFKDNYHEFVLKRLLRMAAEQGYDSIGWTPADIQSERWSDEFAEGYRIEYDQEMPKFLRKYGRQWGAKVENTSIPKQTVDGRERILKETELENVKRDIESEKRELARHYDSYEKARIQMSIDSMEKTVATLEKELSASLNVWSMDITDSMKKSVLTEGQPLFSERDTDTSNRSILANALEGVAQNDIEKNKLKEYKEKISLIESEEQRLSEIQKQLFTKGGVEASQRKELQFEAKQIANRINTYDRQLLNLESTTALKNVLNREKALAMKRQKQKDNEALKMYKEKVAKTTRELMTRHQESRKKAMESREKTAMRHKIQKVVGDLNTLLLKPTKERHVPEEMRIAVAEALSIVNLDTVDADTRVAKYNDLIAKAKDPDVIASLTATRDRILNQGSKLSEKLSKLKEAYNLVRDSADDSLRSMYDDVIYSRIETVQNKVGKTPIRNMTLEQLESVYDLYKMVLTTIRDSNKAFAENITITRLALGSNTFAEIKENNKARDTIKHPFLEKSLWQYLKPMQAMKTIGSGTLQKLWNNILYGQEVFAQDYDEAVKFAKEIKDKYGYKKWNTKKLYSFESKSGKTMKVSLEQMMSIYAYSKRAQADEHIEYGGIVLNEGIIEEKNKLGKTVKVKVNDSTAYRLDKMQVGQIIDTLEKEAPGAKAFVDEMQKYLSETMGAKGNEVSMKMYGINLFKEEHYFPLKSSKDFMEAANAKLKGDVKIKNKGMTKSTVEHARNPIVLENFLDVWGNHINEMAMYHGLVLPLEDFSRTLNYSFKADEDLNTDAESVRTALHDAFGDNADNYINELLKAINGGVLHDSSAQFADKMISKFKKAKVMASLSVIVQQPTAIIRAMNFIEPKYFVAQSFNHKTTWEELKKYCPTAIIKETGSFDTNMGRTIVDMIKDERGFTDKVGDFLGKAPAYMDEVGWNMIWRALKKKVATEQKLSGEALLQECGKQMTLIINETQVYDSVMSRNELMRSKSTFTKMATAFMAEPTTVANMIYGAGLDFKRGKKGFASKTVAATVTSVVINGLVSSLAYALRDDDEDETFLEKYLSSATTEVLDGLNPLTYIPYIKDAYSLFQGYKVERTDMALIGDVYDALNKFYNVFDPEAYEGMSRKEIAKHIYENSVPVLTSICDMFGLPVGNILRDAEAIIVNDNLPMSQTSSAGIGYAFKEGLLSTMPKLLQKIIGTDSKQDKLYDAIVSRDTAYVDRLKSGYKDDKAYETAVRKALRENDSRIREAAEARISGDIAGYSRIVKEIKAEGFFSQDTIVASINAEINAINKGEDTKTSSNSNKASSIYKIEDYYASIVGGDQASAYVVKEDLINTDIANGKDRDEAETSFNGKFASYLREEYEKGNVSTREAQRMLVNYGGKSEEDAASKVQYWEFKQEYPDYDDLSEEGVDKYYNEVEPHGIRIDVYYDYYKQRSKCKGVDNNRDGKTDSGSVKAEVLRVINSLPLTYAQKDALYYLNGWSAKTIWEAPWH